MVAPYYVDDWLTVYHGDARAVMAEMEPESVHCVVTSPPYWGLRDYGTATWEGGDAECDHRLETAHQKQGATSQRTGRSDVEDQRNENFRAVCGRCGAKRVDGQLGLEPTPDEYVANLVAVFREVRRVLRPDGTVWLNLGDSYSSGGRKTRDPGLSKKHPAMENWTAGRADAGLTEKQLVGIPWRVAFALQADGWYLRSDIIWSKPNPMPESITDRPTKSHEYLFLLSKSPRYYFDAEAVREPANGQTPHDLTGQGYRAPGQTPQTGNRHAPVDEDDRLDRLEIEEMEADTWAGRYGPVSGRNIRSVWTIATQPYPGAHFATFPTKLVEPCIKAGTSERGVCLECGAPWVRVVEQGGEPGDERDLGPKLAVAGDDVRASASARMGRGAGWRKQPQPTSTTTGWRPTCEHYPRTAEWPPLPPRLPKEDVDHYARRITPQMAVRAELLDLWAPLASIPATVLDPFGGSGTVGLVAQSLSRRAVLIDLSLDYLGQLMVRNAAVPLGLGA